jgi:hypothetical protein
MHLLLQHCNILQPIFQLSLSCRSSSTLLVTFAQKQKWSFLLCSLHCPKPNIKPFHDQNAVMLASQKSENWIIISITTMCSKFVDVTMKVHGLTWNHCSNQNYVLHQLFSPHWKYGYNKMLACKTTSHNQQFYCSFAFVYLFHRLYCPRQ